MPEQTYACYCISGFQCDPEEISSIVGVAPTRVGRIGDRSAAPLIPVKENFWQLDSRLSRDKILDAEAHVDDVLAQLECHLPKVLKASSAAKSWIQVVSYSSGANSGIHLSTATITRMHKLGCELDCDLYSLGNEQDG
jgi:hypothetical protein